MNNFVKYAILFVVLVFLQEFLFNNIELNTYMNPYIYVLFILMLPFKINRSVLLLVSFLLGCFVDLLAGTPGLQASACVVVGLLRPYVLSVFISRDEFEEDIVPAVRNYGMAWFVKYAAVLILIHHFVLFTLESFTFVNYWTTIARIILSSMFTLFFVVLCEYAFSHQR